MLYDCVGFQVAYGLKLEEELGGDGVVVERFAVLGRFFPFGVLRFRPARFEVSVKLGCEVINEVIRASHHSLTGSSSYQ